MWLLVGVWATWLGAVAGEGPAVAADERPLSLTSVQLAEIWRSLGKEAMKALEPAGLKVGEVVPQTMHLLPFSHRLRKKIPAIKPYLYALLHGQVLVIDPVSKKIISIVDKN